MRARCAGLMFMLVLAAGCTDDFSRFKFGKKTTDAGAQNASSKAGNSGQSSADASTAASNVQQRARGDSGGTAGTGQPQAQGTRTGAAGANPGDAEDLADRDD
jgi:hypothetical protein